MGQTRLYILNVLSAERKEWSDALPRIQMSRKMRVADRCFLFSFSFLTYVASWKSQKMSSYNVWLDGNDQCYQLKSIQMKVRSFHSQGSWCRQDACFLFYWQQSKKNCGPVKICYYRMLSELDMVSATYQESTYENASFFHSSKYNISITLWEKLN